jgi:hypothetical protein
VDEPSENGVVVNGWRRAVFRLGAAAGIAGPAAFTGAWIASSLRQTRQGPGGLQLSGLAAPDARDPWIMLAGFLVTGGCTVAFGAALRQALRGNATRGAGPGPALIQGAGLLTVAAGLLRRDHMLLNAPGEPGASWHSTAHDAISGLVYVNLVAAQLALAWRFGRDPAWRHWRPWLLASAAATGVILIAYAADVTGTAAAILQRAAVPKRGSSPPPEPGGEPRRAGAMSSQRLLPSRQSNQLAGLPTGNCTSRDRHRLLPLSAR